MNNSKKLRLLVLCQLFYPELVSTGQTLTELCEELSDMGVDIEVICGPPTYATAYGNPGKTPRTLEYRGIKIRRLPGTRFPKNNLLGRLVNQMTFALSVLLYTLFDRSRRPILALTNPPFLGAVCALQRKPFVYLMFDIYPDTAVKLGLIKGGGLAERAWDFLNLVSFKRASSIVVIGRCMRDVVLRKKAAASKIRMIHVWSDDRNIRHVGREDNPLIDKWGLGGKFVLGYFGNAGWFHDMETVMEAARRLDGRKDIVFLFVGEGHKKRWMMDFAEKHGLGNCLFYPYVGREALKYSLSSADVGLVSLANGHEGLSVPSKTFGLMAAGLPVIAVMPEASEIARIIAEERCGIVVKPGDPEGLADSTLRLYENRDIREEMGRNSKQAIDAKYNLRRAAEAYHEIFRDING